jgi:hypothetical protein
MSRNGSGTYNLPAGNPVVTGTTISSTWANNTLADIQNALTGSIAADGQTPITGALSGTNGTVSFAGVGQTRIPSGTTAQRAATPLDGMIRYNTDLQQYEGYKNGAWSIFGNGAGGTLFSDTVTATQGQTVVDTPTGFVLGGDNLSVYVNGSRQIYNVNYTETSTTQITFTNGLNVGDLVNYTIGASTSLSVNASSVLYNEGGTGAVDRNVEQKLQETVSVKDFGAVGDGVTDDTAAINAAITYIGSSGGGSVYAPRGTYMVSSSTDAIKINYDNVRLYGDGIGSTIFKNLASSTGTVIHAYKGTYPGGLTPIQNIIIENLTVDGNQANIVHNITDTYQNGINFDYPSDCIVHQCEVKNVVFQGIVMQGSGDGLSKNCKIYACDVSACGEFGIGLEGGMWKSIVSNNTVHDLITVSEVAGGAVGVYVGAIGQVGQNNIVIGNAISNIPCNGIQVGDGSVYTLICNNILTTIGTTAGSAIKVIGNTTSPNHVQITGNRISAGSDKNSSSIAILNSSTSVGYATVNGNTIADSVGGGIQINSGTGAVVSGNAIAGIGSGAGAITSGIRISASCVNTDVSGNVINTTAGNGVEILAGCTNTAVRSDNRYLNISGTSVSNSGTNSIIEGIIVAYNPTWTSTSSPQPALGNGALSGRYVRVGNIVHLNLQLIIGTTTTVGTNVWEFSVPIPPAATPFSYQPGPAYIIRTGVAEYSCIARVDSAGAIRIITSAVPASSVGSATPFAWASTDLLEIQISYEV